MPTQLKMLSTLCGVHFNIIFYKNIKMKLTKEEIILSSKFSNLSYLQSKELDTFFYTRPLKKVDSYIYELIEKPYLYMTLQECQFLVAELKDKIIISFKGTDSRSDIFTDLNFMKERLYLENYLYVYNHIFVHKGFFNQFKSTKGVLNYKMSVSIKSKKPIIFTGHSSGGALATISSLVYSYLYLNYDISCITFGSPRVGCYKFSEVFNLKIKDSLRFVKDNDPVPCIPSPISFKHVKKCMWINNGSIENNITVYRSLNFIKNTFLNSFGYGYNALKDHSCVSYIEALEELEDLEALEKLEDLEALEKLEDLEALEKLDNSII